MSIKQPETPSERVLIVDDNPLNVLLLKTLLSPEDYAVAVASNGQQALDEVTRFNPKLILMDLQLPDLDGLTLTRQLKTNPATRHIRIVALTAYSAAEAEDAVRAAGCDGFLAKPVDPVTFLETVRRHLAESMPIKTTVQLRVALTADTLR